MLLRRRKSMEEVDNVIIVAVNPSEKDKEVLSKLGFKSVSYDSVLKPTANTEYDFSSVSCDILVGSYALGSKKHKTKNFNAKGHKIKILDVDITKNKIKFDVT